MSLSHRIVRMTGRDPAEPNRTSTPLELLFDLTFVVAFSQISSQTAHYLDIGDVETAIKGFSFTIFGATWAWINYSWLASAYDNDDIFFRMGTLVEMMGVLVFALGVPRGFESIAQGVSLDNGVVVAVPGALDAGLDTVLFPQPSRKAPTPTAAHTTRTTMAETHVPRPAPTRCSQPSFSFALMSDPFSSCV